MFLIFEKRASVILYNTMLQFDAAKTWLVPANVCPIVIACFIKAKRRFELIDLAEDLCIDRAICLEKISNCKNKYAGIIYVHSYGIEQNQANWIRQLRLVQEDIFVIQDKCLCRPQLQAEDHGADLILFSTGYAKYIDLGFGGFAFSRFRPTYTYGLTPTSFSENRLKDLDLYLKGNSYLIDEPLFFSDWLDQSPTAVDISVYFSKIQFALDPIRQHKERLNNHYSNILSASKGCLPVQYMNWRYNMLVTEPSVLIQTLRANGLFASQHYPAISRKFGGVAAPRAERLSEHVVNLFNDRYFTLEQAERTAGLVEAHTKKYGHGEYLILIDQILA